MAEESRKYTAISMNLDLQSPFQMQICHPQNVEHASHALHALLALTAASSECQQFPPQGTVALLTPGPSKAVSPKQSVGSCSLFYAKTVQDLNHFRLFLLP